MANNDDYFMDEAFEVNRALEGSIAGYRTDEFGVGNDNLSYGIIKGALRFLNITVNQGASVSTASLRISSRLQGAGSGNLKFKTYGMDEDNTANFTANPFARSKTSAFDSADNPLPGLGNYKQITVTSIVNEIVQRGGWSSGNAMGFMLEDDSSPSDVWLYNQYPGEDDNVLSILVNSNPDFTPGPYTQRVGRPPSQANFGIRISKPGVDALTNNIQNLHLFSKANVLKAVRDAERGWTPNSNLEKVSHGLKYPPAFLAFYKIGGTLSHANMALEISGIPYVQTYSTQETIEMLLDPNADDPDSWYYYVFIDENV